MTITLPFLGMMLLTFTVWLALFIGRIACFKQQNTGFEQLKTPEAVAALLPSKVNNIGNNFKNLFELPVVFYVLCIYLVIEQKVDNIYVIAAYGFFALRFVHSLVHCTVNLVSIRFFAYTLSSLCLWFMLIRIALMV